MSESKKIAMDWQQVVLNGGPPCFAVLEDEEGWYCGRAQRWEGHDGEHKFVSLQNLLDAAIAEKDAEIHRIKEQFDDLDICEFCDVSISSRQPIFNVCGPCYNSTVNDLLSKLVAARKGEGEAEK